jgi:hypothetical protein
MTLKTHVDRIETGDNIVIGLGDSFTQGVGAYSNDIWASFSKPRNLHNISGQLHIDEQGKNNWVRQLKNSFLPDYKCMSLGVNGGGNRAAVKELYLNPLPDDVNTVIVILMATGLERFDFLKNEKRTAGPENHQKWKTIWPTIDSNRDSVAKLESEYAKNIWSEKVDVMEFLMNVAEAQEFCRSKNYKFLFGSAFDQRIDYEYFKQILGDDVTPWLSLVDWSNFIAPSNCSDFMDYIRKLENHPSVNGFWEGSSYCNKLEMPLKYITPCYHWTIEGNYEIAKALHNILRNRSLI